MPLLYLEEHLFANEVLYFPENDEEKAGSRGRHQRRGYPESSRRERSRGGHRRAHPVKQKGRDFWCCCPLHQEKTPSFKIDPATQLWHCFGCGEGGDVFLFIMKTEDFNFPEAVRYLADRAHIDIAEDARGGGVSRSVKSRMKEICARTAEFYHTQLMRGRGEGPDAARKYLASRGFGVEVPK